MKYLTATVAALGLTLAAAAPLHAQGVKAGNNNNVNAGNLVAVSIGQVAEDIASNLNVNVEDVQALNNVSVPVGIAANVCDVTANVLAQQRKDEGGASCTATSTNDQLNRAVQNSLGGTTQTQ